MKYRTAELAQYAAALGVSVETAMLLDAGLLGGLNLPEKTEQKPTAWDLATPTQRRDALNAERRRKRSHNQSLRDYRAGRITAQQHRDRCMRAVHEMCTPQRATSQVGITAGRGPHTGPRQRERRTGSQRRSLRAGPDDDPHEPEPSRTCEGCGIDISDLRPDAKTCSQPKCKKRAQRMRANPARYPGIDADPYLTLPYWDLNALQQAAIEGCRCNGNHLLGEDGDCVKCGRPYRDKIAPFHIRLWERMDRRESYVRAVSAGTELMRRDRASVGEKLRFARTKVPPRCHSQGCDTAACVPSAFCRDHSHLFEVAA